MRAWPRKPDTSISPMSPSDLRQDGSAPSAHLRRRRSLAQVGKQLKAAERNSRGTQSALDGVASALPALLRAEKLQRRAARAGFDWPDPQGPAEKIVEEIEELAQASDAERAEEAGDLLFAAVNLVRAYGIAPEDALRAANIKFERRFRSMEAARRRA